MSVPSDPPGLKRRLTCILAADAVGYSRHVSDDEGQALRVLAAHRAVIDGIIAFHDGRIFNTGGDSVLAEFASAVEAVRAAIEIQDALRTCNESLPEAQRMPFRIGINLGDVVVKGNDLLGDGVNVAARLESAAAPGGILIASSVYDQITGKLDLAFQDMGEQALKNISRPIRAFSVTGAGGTVRALPTPPTKPEAATSRRLGAVAIVTIVALGVAAVLAVTQGWLTPPAREDTVKGKLEAELAAAERARQEAEQRAMASASEAARLRAESELASLKAKAEADAAAMKAKASSDAAAIRAQAASEAQRAQVAEAARAKAAEAERTKAAEAERARLAEVERAKVAEAERGKATDAERARAAEAERAKAAEAERAKAAEAERAKVAEVERAKAAERAQAARTASPRPSYDGAWSAVQRCGPAGNGNPAFTREFALMVANGEFVLMRGTAGHPGYIQARGRVAQDGRLTLNGTGTNAQQRPIVFRLDGGWEGDRFQLAGVIGSRHCRLEITRADQPK